MDVPASLKKLYQQGRLVPFIGAGVSQSVEWQTQGQTRRGPSWKELVDQAARELGFAIPDLLRARGTDLQILEYLVRKIGSSTKLTNWMVQNMHPADSELQASVIHRELAMLTECKIFYTTNYDDFLERALRLHGRDVSVVAAEKHMGGRSVDCEVIKFHGDWDNTDQMVLSESDYEKRLNFQTALDYRFRADLLGRAVLFVGYSFRDPNVAYLFRTMNDQFSRSPASLSGRRAYIPVPDPSDFEIRLFDARNIEVLSIAGADHAREVADLLSAIRSY
jgi:hypothetical protein